MSCKAKLKNNYLNKTNLKLTVIMTLLLSACSNGNKSSDNGGNTPVSKTQIILVGPSLIPSLPESIGTNYIGVYNTSNSNISNLNYKLSQSIGSGTNIEISPQSALECATITAKGSCYLKLSIPESSLAGGAIITVSNDNEIISNQLPVGIQQIYYNNESNANGVGLYFYPKVQYSSDGAPYTIITAVVLSPNVTNINTIQLVDESGDLIPNQYTISDNSGVNKPLLAKGSVVSIRLAILQGVNKTQTFKVQTSYQTLTTSILKTDSEHPTPTNTSNTNIGTTSYSILTQGDDINLQLTPKQIFLTASNPIQYGYLSNIGNLQASQIQLGSASQNVSVTTTSSTLNGQNALAITYKLIDTSIMSTTNTIYTSGVSPSNKSQISFG